MKLRLFSSAAVLGLLLACGGEPHPAPPPEPAPAPSPAAHEDPIPAAVTDRAALRETAHRLAGLEAGDGADPVLADHAERMDALFEQLETRHLQAMRAWAGAELAPADPEAPLFYPFSGPDLPNALELFPRASSYVLVGLEPPGRIPDLSSLDAGALGAELERLRGGLENLVDAGYFVTKKMEHDFVAPHLEGVLPLLYIFSARAGLTPQAVRFVRLDETGAVEPLETVTPSLATAVRIDFGGEAQRSLFYFGRDLSNGGLAAAPGFVAFLRRLGAFNVYLKSASYLLHMEGFTALEELLLEHAGTVLQDDSGIPLRDFPHEEWRLRFFGTYERTLPTYREWFQEDLKAVYDRGEAAPLPFAIGYHSQIGGSCLIWAERTSRE